MTDRPRLVPGPSAPDGSRKRIARPLGSFPGLDTEDIPVLLIAGLTLGAFLVAAIRVLQMFTTISENVLLETCGITVAAMLLILVIVVLAATYWDSLTHDDVYEPYLLILVGSVALVGVAVESFAGVTYMLWRHDVVPATGEPSLWETERYYLWHVVDALPFLRVPHVFNLSRPTILPGYVAGAVLLAFKVLVIVPILRLGVAGYQRLKPWALRVQAAARKRREPQSKGTRRPRQLKTYGSIGRWGGRQLESTGSEVLVLFAAALAAIAGVLVMVLCISWSSPLHRAIDEPLRSGFTTPELNFTIRDHDITVGPYHLTFGWVPPTIDAILGGGWLLLVLLGFAAGVAFLYVPLTFGSRRVAQVGYVVVSGSLLVPLFIALCGASVALGHVGVSRSSEPVDPNDDVSASIGWLGREAADSIPILDLTQTLRWPQSVVFVDPWSGTLLLILELGLLVALVWPCALVAASVIDGNKKAQIPGGPTSNRRKT